ncbi:ABC transporter ATP-binding protein [Actinomadura sp. WMMA1423]|uniref:ABC transporter ATP-binding protein n=1 Tax=Actinomadura sp. WMMA1423 TaxID=2591108 RepID=UPI0011479DDA|nr:ABC transporter ATP-binding protein [Actinomadura sp. WMMA1423]
MTIPDPVVELRGVHAAYGDIQVLHGIDLAVPAGAVVALLGPNGAGKTTTMKIVSGLLRPASGTLHFSGRDVTGITAAEAAGLGVCSIPEGRGVFANLTVRENLWVAAGRHTSLDAMEEVAYARFPRLGERRNQLAGSLSGGEQQMLSLSRALGRNPAVLLLDELSMGLAPLVVTEMYEVVAGLAADGVSILLAEQFARVVLPLADLAVLMVNGRAVRTGPPAEIEEELSTTYLGG